MTLREYLEENWEWLRKHRHPKTCSEIRFAVDKFCIWWGGDMDMDFVTPAMVEEFQAAEETLRRRQVTSNLWSLFRLYDPDGFPKRVNTLIPAPRTTEEIPATPTLDRPPTFSEFAYLYVTRRAVCEGYANTLRVRAAAIERWAGTTALKEILREEVINQFLKSLGTLGSPWTRNKWRQDVLAMWRAAADEDFVGYPNARRIRREKIEQQVVECYTEDEARALVAAAESLRGYFPTGIPRRFYWAAIVRFGWDTGLRRGDCFRWDRACLQNDLTFRIVQHKTRKPIRRKLRPETVAALDKLSGDKPLAWQLAHPWSFGHSFQRIVVAAGVDRGTFKWLRRATGSYVEALHPGAGHRAIGNTTQVFNTHYNADLAGEVLMPPPLDAPVNGKGVAI